MADRTHYWHRARECVAVAECIRDPQERLAMLGIAQAFLRMADHAGRGRATAHTSSSSYATLPTGVSDRGFRAACRNTSPRELPSAKPL
jgi:hypothetical protein